MNSKQAYAAEARERKQRIEDYRMIMGSWYLLSGITPFEEYCNEQIEILIKSNPQDAELIRRAASEVVKS